MRQRLAIHDYLDPGETLAEVLFGLIMVLSFTIGASLLTAEGELDARELIVAAVGCNLAWGVIDATLFVLDRLFYRSRRARFFRALKNARGEAEGIAVVQEEFGLEDEPLDFVAADRARLYRSILAASVGAKPARIGVRRKDLLSALLVFVLVACTAVPAVIPFLLIEDPYLALRLSNFLLVSLLFVVGYWWAHYTDARPWRVGAAVTVLGVAMVLVAVALGG